VNYLLDTNVVSEARRKRPDARVASWLKWADERTLHISVMTLGEIVKGAAQHGTRDRTQASIYDQWLEIIRSEFADRTIGVDTEIAQLWGRLAAKRPIPIVDGLLAATAVVHGMTLVTRNARDVAELGVSVLNPWEA
jgi:predicted nucleic acid-binding protein